MVLDVVPTVLKEQGKAKSPAPNMDAISVAAGFGIAPDRAVTYRADAAGTKLNYDVVSDTVACLRAGAPLAANWKKRIEKDVKERETKPQ